MSYVRMQTMLNRNGVEVGHILFDLVDKDLLISDKRGRWTSYTLESENFQILQAAVGWLSLSFLTIMSEEEQLKLLAANGMLIKRPLLIDGHTVLVGFRETEWSEKLK